MAELAVEVGGLDDRDDDLVVETITRHAAALLRTARRHSLCLDDAHDAYQRALEIFVRRAASLRRETVVSWLHTVVKHEAMAVREARAGLVASEEVDLDAQACTREPAPDERVVAFDRTARAAEALGRLKPQEVTALWLKAQGLSYREIAERQSWTYTKVNRCLTEGRKAFLARYAGIESGEECRRWAPVINALVDGEVSARDRREVRAHLRNCAACRSTVRELRSAGPSLAGVLPVSMAEAPDALDRFGGFVARVYDALAGGVHDRAAASVVKLQAAAETASAGKVAVVAASAAAIATGGAIGAGDGGVLRAPPDKTPLAHGAKETAHAGAASRHHRRLVARSAAATRTSTPRQSGSSTSTGPRPAGAAARAGAHEFGFEGGPSGRGATPPPQRHNGPTASAASISTGGPPRQQPARPRRATSNGSPEFGFEATG